jgi:hypothetical protein
MRKYLKLELVHKILEYKIHDIILCHLPDALGNVSSIPILFVSSQRQVSLSGLDASDSSRAEACSWLLTKPALIAVLDDLMMAQASSKKL